MRWGTIFFPLLLLVGCSQTSPEKPTQTLAQDSIQIWANTAKDSWDMDLEKRQILIERAYNENAKIKDRTQKVKNLSRISLAYSNLGDSLNFRGTNRELMTLAQEIGDNIAHGRRIGTWGISLGAPYQTVPFTTTKRLRPCSVTAIWKKKWIIPGVCYKLWL